MLDVLLHVWYDREPDQHTDAVAIARKIMTWGEEGGKAMRQGLTATEFIRLQLDLLGIGQYVSKLHYGRHDYKLPLPGFVKAADGR